MVISGLSLRNWELLPGRLLYGTGLALVLTVNDPVSLDSLAEAEDGQASRVSATAEQAGGAVGIALLYTLFHNVHIGRLHYLVDSTSLKDLATQQREALRSALQAGRMHLPRALRVVRTAAPLLRRDLCPSPSGQLTGIPPTTATDPTKAVCAC